MSKCHNFYNNISKRKSQSELLHSSPLQGFMHVFFKGAVRHDYRLRQKNEAKALRLLIRYHLHLILRTYLSTLLIAIMNNHGFISIQYQPSPLVNLNDKIIELHTRLDIVRNLLVPTLDLLTSISGRT
jgi:hypothetical protein